VSAATPSPEVCRLSMLDHLGVARIDDVRPAVVARFAEIVVGTAPNSSNMRLDARRSACDDPRVSGVLYDFDGAGVLQEVTFVWIRPPGPAPAPIFKERAAVLARSHRLPASASPSRLEGSSATAAVVLMDVPERNVVLETYTRPK
jgi:hypothetical protein